MPATTPSTRHGPAIREAHAHLLAGRLDRYLEICAGLEGQPGAGHVLGQCGLLLALPMAGRAEEAMAIAEDTLAAARAHANPWCIAFASSSPGGRTPGLIRPGPCVCYARGWPTPRSTDIPLFEANIAQKPPGWKRCTATPGRPWHCSTPPSTASTEPATPSAWPWCSPTWPCASTGSISQMSPPPSMAPAPSRPPVNMSSSLPGVVDHLRAMLGDTAFDKCAATGAAMDAADAVAYARHHIELARRQAANPDSGRT